MRTSFLKAFSLFLLLSVVVMFTGLSTIAAAAVQEMVRESCCNGCNQTEGQTPVDCDTPDCPHFLCLSTSTSPVFTLSYLPGSVYIFQTNMEPFLKLLVRPVFRPPASLQS